MSFTRLSFLALALVAAAGSVLAASWDDHNKAGLAALHDGNLPTAEQEFLAARKKAEKEGNKYGNYATTLVNLGSVYDKKGKPEESEKNFKEALAIYEKSFGKEAIQDANALEGLADLYRHSKRFAEAIPLYMRTIRIREKISPDHPDLADTINGLADCYRKTGKNADAVPLYTRVLDIRQKALGSNHPRTAKSMENLAAAYAANNKFEMAEPVYEKLVTARESSAGPEDPKVASALEELAMTYSQTGKYKKAASRYKRALAIRESNAKSEPAELSKCLKAYAAFLRKTGLTDEAIKMEARAKKPQADSSK
jgi:tetratricopeptide (TPR) repeat protein